MHQNLGQKNLLEVGKKIKKGDTIMIVEAMKTMNHVPSTADGVVKEICVADGQASRVWTNHNHPRVMFKKNLNCKPWGNCS
jgi:hypothetical protein